MDKAFLRQQALALWSEAHRLQQEGELDQAIEPYSRSIRLYPTAEAHTFLGWAYSLFQRWDDAIAECKKAIHIDPAFGNPYNDIGVYLLAQDRLDGAITWLEKAKKATRYDSRHTPFMNLGRIFVAKGMLNRARKEFQGALTLYPGEPSCVAALDQLSRTLQ